MLIFPCGDCLVLSVMLMEATPFSMPSAQPPSPACLGSPTSGARTLHHGATISASRGPWSSQCGRRGALHVLAVDVHFVFISIPHRSKGCSDSCYWRHCSSALYLGRGDLAGHIASSTKYHGSSNLDLLGSHLRITDSKHPLANKHVYWAAWRRLRHIDLGGSHYLSARPHT